ncbi:MAG: hypothetical protein NTW07_13745 [candidate division Zixibacteria bacterium]|nr:hypothetical protein [candidate division Zixibacteria bacterium]
MINLISILKIGTVLATVYVLVALAWMLVRTGRRGLKPTFATGLGSENKGIVYAFFKGMLPSEKESVRKHLPTFVGGLLYHAGVFAAFTYLGLQIVQVEVWPSALLLIQILMTLGLVCGAALLLKRLVLRKMRVISTPDDFVANILVDLFLVFAISTTIWSTILPVYLVMTMLLLLYVPMGKIRHCVFFFCTRTIFGRLFGRRGVLPHPAREQLASSR